MDATEHGDSIVFLHAVKDGPANRSYGLQVAQLAGVPRDVIAQARRYLEMLESQRDRQNGSGAGQATAQKELPLFDVTAQAAPLPVPTDELRTALAAIDPDELSPKAALETLYKLRKLV